MSEDSDLFNHYLNQPQNSMFEILEYLHDNNINQPTNDITEPSLFSPEENEHDMDNTYNYCFSNFQNSQNNIYNERSEEDEIRRNSFPYMQLRTNKHTNNINRTPVMSLVPYHSEEVEEREELEKNQTYVLQPNPEITTNNNILNIEPNNENIPQEIQIAEKKPIFKIVKKKWNEYILLAVDYLIYMPMIFILFGHINSHKGLGRKDNYLKQLPNTITAERSKNGNRPDNFKEKVINTCFKSISFVISNLFLAFGKSYKLGEINKKANELKSNDLIVQYLNKKMVDIVKESFSKKKENETYKNRGIYNRLDKEGKIGKGSLLETILNMPFGEVVHNFVMDFNFVKNAEPNNNDFHTYSYYKNEFKEANYPDHLIKSTQNTLIELTIIYAS